MPIDQFSPYRIIQMITTFTTRKAHARQQHKILVPLHMKLGSTLPIFNQRCIITVGVVYANQQCLTFLHVACIQTSHAYLPPCTQAGRMHIQNI